MRQTEVRLRGRREAVWAVAICAGLSVQAQGQQYKFDPRIQVTGLYDDNYRLDGTGSPKISVEGSTLDASIALQRLTPTTSVMFVPRIWSSYFPGHTEEDSNDQFGYLALNHVGQTHVEGLTVEYRRQTLLKENLPDANSNTEQLGQPGRGNDVGIFFQHARQVLWLLDPSAQYDLTPRQRLEFKAEYLDTTYSQQARTDYTPYTNSTASGGYDFIWSPRTTLIARVKGASFRPQVGADSTTVGGELEWDTRWTEKSRYYFRAGIDHTNYDASTLFNTAARSANSGSFGAGVNWTFQVTTVFLDGIRSVAPSAGGFAVVQDQLRFRVEHRFTPLLAGFVNASALKNDSQGGEQASNLGPIQNTNLSDRRYAQSNVGLEWRVRREWAVTGTYGYTWQHYVNLGNAGHSDDISISVIWQPHRPADGPAVTVGY
jgi:hypothetical protein